MHALRYFWIEMFTILIRRSHIVLWDTYFNGTTETCTENKIVTAQQENAHKIKIEESKKGRKREEDIKCLVSFFKYFGSVKLQDRFWPHLQQSLMMFLWQRGEDGIAHDGAFQN